MKSCPSWSLVAGRAPFVQECLPYDSIQKIWLLSVEHWLHVWTYCKSSAPKIIQTRTLVCTDERRYFDLSILLFLIKQRVPECGIRLSSPLLREKASCRCSIPGYVSISNTSNNSNISRTMARRPLRYALMRSAKVLSMVWLWVLGLILMLSGYVVNEAITTQFRFSEDLMLSIASTTPPSLSGETVLGTGCEALRDTRYMRVSIDMRIPETTRNINNPVFATSVVVIVHTEDYATSNVSKEIVVRGEKMSAVSFKPGLEKTVRAFIMWLPRVLRIVDDFERIQFLAVDTTIPNTASATAVLPSCKAATVEVNVQALSEVVMHVASVRVTSTVWKYNIFYRAIHRVRFLRLIFLNTLLCLCIAAFTRVAIIVGSLTLWLLQVFVQRVSWELSLLSEAMRKS